MNQTACVLLVTYLIYILFNYASMRKTAFLKSCQNQSNSEQIKYEIKLKEHSHSQK